MSRKHHIVLLSAAIILIGITILYLIDNGLRIYCPFNLITNLNCPGCGNTRAMMALVHFDFKSMLHYNLLFPLEIFYLIRIFFILSRNYIKYGKFSYGSRIKIVDIAFLFIILLWSVIRNCTSLY